MKGKSNLPNFDDLVDEIAKTLYVENVKLQNRMIIILVKLRKQKMYTKLQEI